ncbi:uncharacterized protein LOC124698250 [Lolium rigidum]|uniref:uncharacterized protein LOC124698250 n=1 Tax=Lolium rigidum TaxID=89674 RepID=UPI001F5C3B9E|nr:uncharacterized protein LOC124698250 [Lolium rigidum]
MGGRRKSKRLISCNEEKMNHSVETNIVDDFDNRPLKKPKCSESTVPDEPLPSPPSPTNSTLSPVSELYNEETVLEDSERTFSTEQPDEPKPTNSTLSPVSQLNNEETILEYGENKTFSAEQPDKPSAEQPDEPKTTNSALSPVSQLNNEETILEDGENKTFSAEQPDKPKHIINNVIYEYIPQDYTITRDDECAHDVILFSSEEEILVKIEDVSVKQRYLVCLLDKDKWLDDEVISAYICCLKEQAHAQNQNDDTVFFENPFVTRLLKRDGEIGIHGPTSVTNIVKNYLNHDMIHLPINIKVSHWYLASINFEKSEIQVLDSLCWEHNRDDLTLTLQGLQYHLDIINTQENLSKWKNIDVTKWTITEQLKRPIQKDSSSCGLFMLKFMEYWTGHALSHLITQEIITSFRYKLAAILLCWKNNTAPPTTMFEEIVDSEGHPDDVIMSDKPFDQNQSNDNNSLSAENKYQSLMSVVSNLNIHELIGGLCNYIKSVNSAEALDKVWVQNCDPYPISLTLKNLKDMLNDELPMDQDCFNLVVRKIMFDDIQTVKKRKGLISKHYLDTQF